MRRLRISIFTFLCFSTLLLLLDSLFILSTYMFVDVEYRNPLACAEAPEQSWWLYGGYNPMLPYKPIEWFYCFLWFLYLLFGYISISSTRTGHLNITFNKIILVAFNILLLLVSVFITLSLIKTCSERPLCYGLENQIVFLLMFLFSIMFSRLFHRNKKRMLEKVK